MKPGTVLYRGIKVDISNDYSVGSKGFWPAFSSTSKLRKVAIKTFSDPGTVVFIIYLSKTNPYPHIALP